MVRTSTWVHRGLASAGLYHFLPNTKMFKICMCFYELQYFITTHNPPPPHKIINFTQFCREQIIIKQLHYLYPPFSILHIMGSAIQKQWWLILNLYFDPPSSTRWSSSRRSNSHNTASENSAPYFGSVDRVCKRSSVRDP